MADSTFACAACGKRYRWKPVLAGRAVACPCGATMNVPAEPPPVEDDLYGFAGEPGPPRPTSRAPQSAVAAPPSVAPPQPVLAYQSRGDAAAADAYFPDKLKDFQIPVALIAIGVVVEFIGGWWSGSRMGIGPAQAMARVGAEMVVGTAFMLVAIFIAARFREISFGRFWVAVLKLSAVAIAPSAAMTLLDLPLHVIPFGGLLTWVLGFCFYFALLGMLFDLDQSDTWYCVCVIFLVKLAVFLAALWLVFRGYL